MSPGADTWLLSGPAPGCTCPDPGWFTELPRWHCRAGQKPQCEQGLPEVLLKEREVLCVALSLADFLKNLRDCEMEAVASLTWGNSTERERKKPWRRISSFLSPVPPCLFSQAVGYCRAQKNQCVCVCPL